MRQLIFYKRRKSTFGLNDWSNLPQSRLELNSMGKYKYFPEKIKKMASIEERSIHFARYISNHTSILHGVGAILYSSIYCGYNGVTYGEPSTFVQECLLTVKNYINLSTLLLTWFMIQYTDILKVIANYSTLCIIYS